MAIYEVQMHYLDEQGRTKTGNFIADVADEAALLTAASTFHTTLLTLTKAAVPFYDYRRRVAPGGSPAAGSNLDAGFTIRWDTPLAINPTTKIPDPEEAIKDGQGGIDLTDLDVDAFVALFTAGVWRVNRNTPTQPTAVIKATLDI
jgi:hypothetical protein